MEVIDFLNQLGTMANFIPGHLYRCFRHVAEVDGHGGVIITSRKGFRGQRRFLEPGPCHLESLEADAEPVFCQPLDCLEKGLSSRPSS